MRPSDSSTILRRLQSTYVYIRRRPSSIFGSLFQTCLDCQDLEATYLDSSDSDSDEEIKRQRSHRLLFGSPAMRKAAPVRSPSGGLLHELLKGLLEDGSKLTWQNHACRVPIKNHSITFGSPLDHFWMENGHMEMRLYPKLSEDQNLAA